MRNARNRKKFLLFNDFSNEVEDAFGKPHSVLHPICLNVIKINRGMLSSVSSSSFLVAWAL